MADFCAAFEFLRDHENSMGRIGVVYVVIRSHLKETADRNFGGYDPANTANVRVMSMPRLPAWRISKNKKELTDMEYLKQHLFTGWRAGKMQRKPFIITSLAMILVVFLFFGVFLLGLVGAETGVAKIFDVSVLEAQDMLRSALSLPAFVVIVAFQVLILVVSCAVSAKRVRDIGLPGWPIVFVFLFLDAVLFNVTIISFLFMVFLIFTPSAVFNVKLPQLFGGRHD